MGTVGNWIGVLFIGTLWACVLAAKVPLEWDLQKPSPPKSIWIGCFLCALALGMAFVFGIPTLQSPLRLIFVPAAATGFFLYTFPLWQRQRAPSLSPALRGIRLILLSLTITLIFALDTRAFRLPFVFVTMPALAGWIAIESIDWIGAKRA